MHELQELNMQGKTHLAVGSALALALLPPAGMHTLIIGTGAAALGSVVSDIDSGHSGAGQDAARVMAVSAIITILTVAADLTFHTGIIDGIRQRLSMNLNLAAGIGFVLIRTGPSCTLSRAERCFAFVCGNWFRKHGCILRSVSEAICCWTLPISGGNSFSSRIAGDIPWDGLNPTGL